MRHHLRGVTAGAGACRDARTHSPGRDACVRLHPAIWRDNWRQTFREFQKRRTVAGSDHLAVRAAPCVRPEHVASPCCIKSLRITDDQTSLRAKRKRRHFSREIVFTTVCSPQASLALLAMTSAQLFEWALRATTRRRHAVARSDRPDSPHASQPAGTRYQSITCVGRRPATNGP